MERSDIRERPLGFEMNPQISLRLNPGYLPPSWCAEQESNLH